MPDIVITLDENGLTIDGVLPEGYRLIVHNHTDDPDLYSYSHEVEDCRYDDTTTRVVNGEVSEGVHCFEYSEPESSPQL